VGFLPMFVFCRVSAKEIILPKNAKMFKKEVLVKIILL